MSEWQKIPTTNEVYDAIFKQHAKKLRVFSSFSCPDGGYLGVPCNEGRMLTEWGIEGAEYPTIGCEGSWDIEMPERDIRHNERWTYWLCVAIEEDTES